MPVFLAPRIGIFGWKMRHKDRQVLFSTEFWLRVRYLLLAPVLYLMKSTIHRDLVSLKSVLENG